VPIAYVFIVLGLGRMCHSFSMTMATFEVVVQQVVRSMDFKTTESETVGVFAVIHDSFVTLPTGYGKSLFFLSHLIKCWVCSL